MTKKVYVASPLGFSEAGRAFLYDKIIPAVQASGCEVLDTWKTNDPVAQPITKLPYGPEKRERFKQANKQMGANNKRLIKEADALVAVLDGVDVDSGTASEIGYAAALGKPVLGYRGDFRLAADNEGSIVNLQVEYFIRDSGGTIITQVDQLEKHLRGLLSAPQQKRI